MNHPSDENDPASAALENSDRGIKEEKSDADDPSNNPSSNEFRNLFDDADGNNNVMQLEEAGEQPQLSVVERALLRQGIVGNDGDISGGENNVILQVEADGEGDFETPVPPLPPPPARNGPPADNNAVMVIPNNGDHQYQGGHHQPRSQQSLQQQVQQHQVVRQEARQQQQQGVPTEIVQLWEEVGRGLEKNQTGKFLFMHNFWFVHFTGRGDLSVVKATPRPYL